MKCPFCSHHETQVVETRVSEDGDFIRRRRRCATCEKRFTTFEMAEIHWPQVVKQNGERVAFSSEKLRTSFTRPLHKRPVPTALVDDAITRIEQKILGLGLREIPSREVGEMVMQELAKLDKVAYIRFASVYRRFKDLNEFRQEIDRLEQQPDNT